jgi:PPOX class probable F420-dependent enzyme
MDVDVALDFVRRNHRAVMATVRADGRPAMSPVVAAVDPEGRVCVSTRETAMKVAHIRRDPSVSLCALPDTFFGEWVQLEGEAEIVSLPEAMELLVAYYRMISGEHPDWDDYRAAMERDRRCLVRFTPGRGGPTRQG